MNKVYRVFLSLFLIVALSVPTSYSAKANKAKRIIGGAIAIGAGAVILNELRKNRKKPRSRKKAKSNSRKRATKRNSGARTSQKNTKNPSLAASKQIQTNLNLLGFNVGAVDGQIGPGTRRQIRRWQTEQAYAATGVLTASQVAHLQSVANGSSQQAHSYDTRYATDLTSYPVYGLIGLQQSLNTVSNANLKEDGKYGATTHNAIADFLISKNYDPKTTDLNSLIALLEGARRSPSIPPATINTDQSTQNAFFNTNSDNTGTSLTVLASTNNATFDSSTYTKFSPDTNALLELSRRVIFHRPEALQNDLVISSWIKEQFPRGSYAQNKALADGNTSKFYNGTGYERNDAIKVLRDQILTTATNEPLKFVINRQVLIEPTRFTPGKGVPIYFASNNSLGRLKRTSSTTVAIDSLSLYLKYLRSDAKFYFDNAEEIGYLPTDEAGARELAKLIHENEYNKLFMKFYINVKSIGKDVEADAGRNANYAADAKFEAIDIVIKARNRSELKSDRTLHRWDFTNVKAQSASTNNTTRELSKFLGMPLHDGRIVKRTNYFGFHPHGFGVDPKVTNTAWINLMHLAQLAANNNLLANDEKLVDFAKRTLSPSDQRKVARGGNLFNAVGFGVFGLDAYSEFEARAIANDIRSNYKDKILSKTPSFPIPSVEIIQLQLGPYDFDNQEFELNWQNNQVRAGNRGAYSFLNVQLDRSARSPLLTQTALPSFKQFPTKIPVPANKAEALTKRLENKQGNSGRRLVYFAIFGDINSPKAVNGTLTYDVPVSRVALFADPLLSELLHEYPVSDGWGKNLNLANNKPVPISDDTAWLFAAKINPALLKNDKFIAEGLRLRRNAERKLDDEQILGSKFIPPHIIRDLKNADENDLSAFSQKLAELSSSTSFDNISIVNKLRTKKNDQGQTEFSIHETLRWRTSQSATYTKGAKGVFNGAFDHYQVTDRGKLPVVFAAMQEEGWYGVTLPQNIRQQNSNVSLDGQINFKVDDAKIINIRKNVDAIVIAVRPTSITLKNDGGDDVVIDLNRSAGGEGDPTVALSDQDILGVNLGADLNESVNALNKKLGSKYTKTEFNGSSISLDTGVYFKAQSANERSPSHVVSLFVSNELFPNKVITISNIQKFQKDVDPSSILTLLEKKYGPPTGGRIHRGTGDFTWVFNEDAKKRVGGSVLRSQCIIHPARNTSIATTNHDPNDVNSAINALVGGGNKKKNVHAIRLNELRVPCGVVLNAMFSKDRVNLILMDTKAAFAHKQNKQGVRNQEVKSNRQKEVESSEIKF